ncbi:MAG: protein-glutamate methylesterase/protein-glutamine glutaminase [Clostridium sp.]|uniref:protein-glutamate methylesterase/protein-glutamine glutaminase n=1 Tax=Clostridium TaxID=1485 RepID=UPI0021539215|nr:chemotaxis response regulator protein-glutamate methylesterase [Clostridium sp. LY3-2]MCR6513602.1 chemotaxis response regulator protein-glutamate methylesterase [Clostridium sp. LY3-2]
MGSGIKIKVAVVDDSAFMRKLISEIIESDESFEVVAKLRNGNELIKRIDELNPDVVTLDLEMPELDGIDTLKELKRKNIDVPVMMISSNTEEGSSKTMECLYNGAVDFVTKPSGAISLDIKKVSDQLIEKLKVVATKSRNVSRPSKSVKVMEDDFVNLKREVKINKNKIDVILIGASTGGPRAIQKVIEGLDNSINKPILIVQHMPVGFTKAFADRLNRVCSLKVLEAEEGMKIENNTVYIARGGVHMLVDKNKRIAFSEAPTMWGVRPAVDKLFQSAVDVYGKNILACLLTGMGRDGADGIKTVKNAGGVTIAQSENTCTIFGMPRAAILTGKVDYILDIDKISGGIKDLI